MTLGTDAVVGKVPVRDSVGAALRFVREHLRLVGMLAAVGALVLTAITLIGLVTPGLSLVTPILSSIISAAIYAALIGAALPAPGDMKQRLPSDTFRVWAAMAVVSFFIIIMLVVLLIPGVFVLAPFFAPYADELQAAQSDQARSMALLSRFAQENPGVIIAFGLFYFGLILALTSRLYLAAPASVDAGRILTFETWGWTKGNTLRIMTARMMLLWPAVLLSSALSWLFALALGLNPFDAQAMAGAAGANLPAFALYSFVAQVLSIGLAVSLEAALSTYLYRGLKPTAAP